MNKVKLSSGILKARGFGLVEALVAAGILGVIATGIISQQKLSVRSSFTIAADTEMNNITKKLLVEIGDEATCSANFGGKIPGDPSTKPYPPYEGEEYKELVTMISGPKIIEVDKSYGISETSGAALKTTLGEIQLSHIRTLRRDATSNEMLLRVYFKRKNKSFLSGFMDVTTYREIPLNIIMDSLDPTKIKSCFGDYTMIATTAVELSCKVNIGVAVIPPPAAANTASALYKAPTPEFPYGQCIHNNIEPACPDGTFLKSAGLDSNNQNTYTCAGIDKVCPANKVVRAFRADGSVDCGDVYDQCPAGSVILKNSSGQFVCSSGDCTGKNPIAAFAGFTTLGAPICNQITSLKNCGTDNFSTEVTLDGTIICNPAAVLTGSCPPGQRVTGIDSGGAITCAKYINIPDSCGYRHALRGIKANGDFDCGPVERPLSCYGAGSTHSYNDCKNLGGVVQNGATPGSHCAFSGSTCPGGWARCYSFGAQAAASCWDTSNTYYCDAYKQNRQVIAPASGGYGNYGSNSVTCYHWSGSPNTSRSCTQGYGSTAYTTYTQVGCY